MPRVRPNGSKWHMKPLPCFICLTKHEGAMGWNTKQLGCCLLHSVIRLPWIFLIEMIAYTFKFIMSQAHSSHYSILKAFSTTSSAKPLT